MNVKVVKKQGNVYTDKNGTERRYDNYYLQLDNGELIAIRCSFTSDYPVLSAIAEKE